MTKLAKPGDRLPFTPFDQLVKPEETRVVYFFRVPSVADQARFERAIAEAGGREWTWFQLLAALRDGVKELLPDEADPERVSVLDELAAIEAEVEAAIVLIRDPSILADDDARASAIDRWRAAFHSPRLATIEALTASSYPRLAAMQADNRLVAKVRGLVACRMFLAGWQNMPGKIRKGLAGVDDATLRQIPDHHRAAIGAWCETLFGPTETEAGN